uniref:Receptor-like serine/threonine-protein kinase n=1 Tax=Leersia perrieri TaxID=77586 RepID=A0A0D9W4V4_9ORYZ
MSFVLILIALNAWCGLSVQASTDTLSPGQTLTGDGKLVSSNGKFALGFFHSKSTSDNNHNDTSRLWYLGIWFNQIPKLTTVWVANRDSPVHGPTSPLLTFAADGANLAVVNLATNSTVWSTQITTQTNTTTILVLLGIGNLILSHGGNTSNIVWQSFDHPTDTLLPGATIGLNKVTNETLRFVSRRNSVDQSPGMYSMELGRDGAVTMYYNSTLPYWSSGAWNGRYFGNVPEMTAPDRFAYTFVDDDREMSFAYHLLDGSTMYCLLDVSGQRKLLAWHDANKVWMPVFTNPSAHCTVHATCGSFSVCNDNTRPSCGCMKGFANADLDGNWDPDERTGGCTRNFPLDCSGNSNVGLGGDKFYGMSGVRMPFDPKRVEHAASRRECEEACLGECSCTAYSFGSNGGCSVWHGELLDVIMLGNDGGSTNSGEILYIHLAAEEFQSRRNHGRAMVGGFVAACFATLCVLLIIIVIVLKVRRKRRKLQCNTVNDNRVCSGLIPFKYRELQRATRNFSEKIGAGGFGAVFKGLLNESTPIAVKRLYGSCREEKQFRAELSSIGIIHHTNIVKMIGFCCEDNKRLLVYEYMPNLSLDAHLFQKSAPTLNWNTRYQIALGVARGLAYLHESCRDYIMHCDIKPQNILLDGSFVPKIADFGMAKLLKRDCSRVMTTTRGTIGYLAPEWISGVAITPKIDVYSYGMVLLEIISGRMNSHNDYNSDGDDVVYFPVHVARKLLKGDVMSFVDHKLHGNVILEEVVRVCKVACWCIQDKEFDRPTMGKVVQILEGVVELDMPPMPRLLEAIVAS